METLDQDTVLRCRKCRKCVVDASSLLLRSTDDVTVAGCNIWHVNFETLPDWMLTSVHQAHWTMGKLNCQYCGARLGGFNFVSRAKCPCALDLSVHLRKSRVDRDWKLPAAAAPRERGMATRQACSTSVPSSHDTAAVSPAGRFGLMAEALCLEAGAHRNQGGAAGWTDSGSPVRAGHRKARSLDYWDCRRAELSERSPNQEHILLGSTSPGSERAPPLPYSPVTDGQPAGSSPTQGLRRRLLSQTSTEEGERDAGERRMTRRERNRMKSLRRKQRRRERWVQSQLQEQKQGSTGVLTSSEEEEGDPLDRDGYTCAVCLDVYFCPYMCHPCRHVFCEPCLRTLARNCPANTPCPLCRTVITHVFFQKDLNHAAKTFFPKEYLSRKQNFQKANCAKWPLPSCRKLFRIFGGFRRGASPAGRRQFPHGGYRLDALDFEDDSRGWRLDMDMVIIYIYSVNWVIGFVAFCFLCYFFFTSF